GRARTLPPLAELPTTARIRVAATAPASLRELEQIVAGVLAERRKAQHRKRRLRKPQQTHPGRRLRVRHEERTLVLDEVPHTRAQQRPLVDRGEDRGEHKAPELRVYPLALVEQPAQLVGPEVHAPLVLTA